MTTTLADGNVHEKRLNVYREELLLKRVMGTRTPCKCRIMIHEHSHCLLDILIKLDYNNLCQYLQV